MSLTSEEIRFGIFDNIRRAIMKYAAFTSDPVRRIFYQQLVMFEADLNDCKYDPSEAMEKEMERMSAMLDKLEPMDDDEADEAIKAENRAERIIHDVIPEPDVLDEEVITDPVETVKKAILAEDENEDEDDDA